jgi:deoxyribodipyrimidine photo-lyase
LGNGFQPRGLGVTTGILWFRRDLRLADNPALRAAMEQCSRLVPLYIHDPEAGGDWLPGAASKWWLHHSLRALQASLLTKGSGLVLGRGKSLDVLRRVAEQTGARRIFWNRLYDPAVMERDTEIKAALQEQGLQCISCNAALLKEPWEIATGKGGPYRVFTAFWRAAREKKGPAVAPLPEPEELPPLVDVRTEAVDEFKLLPSVRWYEGLEADWQPGEQGALRMLRRFAGEHAAHYPEKRDFPGVAGTSRLSPHLHFGEIGPTQVRWSLQGAESEGAEAFVRQLWWREFAHHLLFHFPETVRDPMDARFKDFPWAGAGEAGPMLRAWQRGLTGVPIVDAGMRELWRTGWMHNRVRMIAASLLTKNLRIHWLEGARWFWDTLVDADLANNTLGWQWVAGCGADAAPFFRIFNPVRQGEKFDPDGSYTRRWVPELGELPTRHLHAPWAAPPDVLEAAGVRLGGNYPLPIVDLQRSRSEALEHWKSLPSANR